MKNNRSCPVLLKYLPHGLGSDIFYPVSNKDEEYLNFKKELFRGRDYEFVLLFNSRNIRRKSIPDTILAWKLFMDKLTEHLFVFKGDGIIEDHYCSYSDYRAKQIKEEKEFKKIQH